MPTESANNFVAKYWTILIWVVAAIFAAGGIHAEFTMQKIKINAIDARLDKKIKIIKELEERILDMEKQLEYDRGYIEGLDK